MRRKLVSGLIMGMMLAVPGCGKGNEDADKSQALEKIREENASKGESNSQEDYNQEEQSTESSNVSKEDSSDKKEEYTESTESGDYKVFKDSSKFYKIPFGEEVNGELVIACSIPMPGDEYISGGGFSPDGKRADTYLSDPFKSTLNDYAKHGDLEGFVANMLVAGDSTGGTIDFRLYPASKVTVESEKEYAPNGVELGTADMPAYAYKDPEATDTSQVNFCTTVQISDDLTLMLWCEYDGYEELDMSVEDVGNAFYELVRKE